MHVFKVFRFTIIAIVFVFHTDFAQCAPDSVTPHFLVEAYPAAIEASKQDYSKELSTAGSAVKIVPFFMIVPTIQRWTPGQTVKVAFRGGDET